MFISYIQYLSSILTFYRSLNFYGSDSYVELLIWLDFRSIWLSGSLCNNLRNIRVTLKLSFFFTQFFSLEYHVILYSHLTIKEISEFRSGECWDVIEARMYVQNYDT